ncbi:MAG: hypothetical protein RLZZ623_1624 [Actinomycetota bacterium]
MFGAVTELRPWFQNAVVYQIYPRSFADSNGDGIGDLPGITANLDYLATLGVDVIWLSPIYRSPQDDNGYDISDYQDIDPTFGTLADFDELLSEMHNRGMKLLMDLVVNHTSDEHPWFVESRSSRTNPKRDWYWWQPAREGSIAGEQGAEPTNWGSFFSGPAWELDPETGEYYLHLFSRKQPDLNWENPEVRDAVYAMMRWWLDRGVDGFRMDVINLISKVTPFVDGRQRDGEPFGDAARCVVAGPRIHEFMQEMHREVFAGRTAELLTVGEMPGCTLTDAALFTDPARAELDMVFQFEHVGIDHGQGKFDVLPFDLRLLKASLGRWQTGLADTGWNSLYWNNHDQPRVVSRFGDDGAHRVDSAKLLATVLHLHRGTPYVYQGEELGMTNVPFAGVDDLRDIESLNHFAQATSLGEDPDAVMASIRSVGRDNARTPMQWNATSHAGFTTGLPWIAVNANHVSINAADEVADPTSVFHHYRRLISLRHTDATVAFGDFTMLLPDHPTVYAFLRSDSEHQLLVISNFSSEDTAIDVADAEAWASAEVVLRSGGAPTTTSSPLTLGCWEARVLRRPR